jgi:hypothetical protein
MLASCPGCRTSRSVRTRTRADVRAQVEAARSLGTRGFLLWNPEGLYTRGALSG